MAKSTILYKEKQEMLGKHLRSKEWVMCTGILTVYARKTNPVILKVTEGVHDSFIGEFMEDKKQFKGKSISEVFGKLSKWYLEHGIIFQY